MDIILTAFESVMQADVLLMLFCGVTLGLFIGVIPGLGGLFGMALLVPLTYDMEPIAAFALLLGMGSVITTSDTIPAVLIGVPGSVGAIATVEDGFPLAKQNQAPRALGAAYSASLIGGIFGALVLAVSIPIMQPLVLLLKTPDFLAISLSGLFLVSILSGQHLFKGLSAATLGVLLSLIGIDGQTATERFTFGQLYFWDGLPLAVVFLGIFGLPALMDLMARKDTVNSTAKMSTSAVLEGIRDTLREWRLVLSCSSVGSVLGAIPGIGLPVIEWVAYGIGKRHRKGGPEFGQGNIRGVIAPESANNAKEGGALIPTIAIGLPGSATMSILLGAFIMHGLVPGPSMLTENLSITYSMIFFVAAANILGAVMCLAMTNQLSKITTVPSSIIVPIALVFITLGAFQNDASWIDGLVLVITGLLGFYMKENNWPRAALALGFVLGPTIERYFFLSYQIVGTDVLFRPTIMFILFLGCVFCLRALAKWARTRTESKTNDAYGLNDFVAAIFLSLCSIWCLWQVWNMPLGAALFPKIGSALLLVFTLLIALKSAGSLSRIKGPIENLAGNLRSALILRQKEFLVPLAPMIFIGLIYLIGVAPATIAFVGLMIVQANHAMWRRAVWFALGTAVVAFVVFNVLIATPWPKPLIGL